MKLTLKIYTFFILIASYINAVTTQHSLGGEIWFMTQNIKLSYISNNYSDILSGMGSAFNYLVVI